MHAVDIYGLSEVMGPGVASECVETKDGLHIWEDHFYPEVIDPVTGEVLPDGATGELVFTTLTKEAQPLIRYRTRDLTSLLPGTARSMRRMTRISGRSDDMMIVRGVNASRVADRGNPSTRVWRAQFAGAATYDGSTIDGSVGKPGIQRHRRARLAPVAPDQNLVGVTATVQLVSRKASGGKRARCRSTHDRHSQG
jgi:hypothetical protein